MGINQFSHRIHLAASRKGFFAEQMEFTDILLGHCGYEYSIEYSICRQDLLVSLNHDQASSMIIYNLNPPKQSIRF